MNHLRQEVGYMTVCVAALAASSRAIICVSDKALSYGGLIQWDADCSKIIRLNPSGAVAMISDNGNGPRILDALFEKACDVGNAGRAAIRKTCEDQYRKALDDLVEGTLLRPRQLNRETYLGALTAGQANDIIRSLADYIRSFDIDFDLLVCGLDEENKPFIFDIGSPGIARDMSRTGFQAIGSGWEKAVSRLLFSAHKAAHTIERVLYDCFDAKANAEMAVGVGFEWDAEILLGGTLGSYQVPREIKEIIESAWSKYQRSPFEKFDRKEHGEGPPRDWKEILQEFSDLIVKASLNNPDALQKLKDYGKGN